MPLATGFHEGYITCKASKAAAFEQKAIINLDSLFL
jgi:hypothetical protein